MGNALYLILLEGLMMVPPGESGEGMVGLLREGNCEWGVCDACDMQLNSVS